MKHCFNWRSLGLALPLCFILLAGGCARRTPMPAAAARPGAEQSFDGAAGLADYNRARRSVDGRAIPYERYLAARDKINHMPQRVPKRPGGVRASFSLLNEWTSLGPANVAGMSRSLVIDPANPQNMYTTGINGGVWKSVDGGSTWTETGDFLPVLVIGSLAIAPLDTNTLYAGTGDGFIAYDAVQGAGMFKSTDAAASWQRLASTAADDRFTFVNKIVVSPNQVDRVYAATNAGVLRSDDGGGSWTVVLDRGLPTRGCQDLAIRTDETTDWIIASCGIPSVRTNGELLNKVNPLEDQLAPAIVFVNQDAANDSSPWNQVLTDPNMGFTSLAIAPSSQNVVYAAASAITGTFASGLLAVYRSNDGGATWNATVTNSDPKLLNRVLLGNPNSALCGSNVYTGQAWHDNVLAVDPLDPQRVWIGGVDLMRSDDGGANWGLASYWWASSANPQFSHADHHVLVFHPAYDGASNQTLFDVNDGGVFRTDNARSAVSTSPCVVAGSVNWRLTSTDLSTLQFYHGTILPNGAGYFGGSQDNGTVLGSEAGGPLQWTTILGGDGGATAIDGSNPNFLYASTTGGTIYKSPNGGRSFTTAMSGITESLNNFFLIGTFVMDPNNSQRLWTGGNTIWRSTNGAASWTAASAPLVQFSFGSFAVGAGDGNLVLAGSRTGEIFRSANALSTNASTVWPMTRPRVGWVSKLVFDPVNGSTVYAVYSSFNVNAGDAHIYKSTDSGLTWTATDGTGAAALPDAPYYTLAVDPDNPSVIWVAGDLGLFVSMDGGATWARERPGFPAVPTNHLTIQRDSDGLALYAFTHGRGLWRARIGAVTE